MDGVQITVDVEAGGYITSDVVQGVAITGEVAVGARGEQGEQGLPGTNGVGVPAGGTTGQILKKISDADFDTEWAPDDDGDVDSVNGQTGAVVLDADDIDDTSTTNKFTTASDISKLAGIETGADVTDATNVDAAGATMNTDTTLVGNGYFLDEDTMASNSASKVPSQQSTKAYVDNNLEYPSSGIGLGYRPNNDLYDAWIAKYQAQLASPTPSTPLDIFVIGDSTSSTTSPTFTEHRPWPMMLDILGSQSELNNSYATAGATGWLYAQPSAGTRGMTSTTGSASQSGTGGWSSSLAVTQYATQTLFCNYITVVWGRTSGGGTLEVRETSTSGNLLASINTSGTAKGGFQTDIALTPNFFGRYLGTLYFVASGATCILEGVHLRTAAASARVVNAAHAGYTTNYFTSSALLAYDYAENNQPDVTLIMVGVNDGPTNFQTRLTTLITGLQAVNPDNLIVIVGMYVTGYSLTFTNAMSLTAKSVAETYGCLFVDLNTTYPRFGQNSLLSGDLLHPSQNGHRAIATLMEAVLMGNPLGIVYNTAISAGSYLPAVSAYWPYTTLSVQEALDYIATGLMWRAGTPEGNLTANVGTLARDTTNGVLYVKATGTGNTGWLAVPAAATISETNTGTSTTKGVTPDGLAGSNFGIKEISIPVVAAGTALTTGDGKAYFRVPSSLNGMNLVNASAAVTTTSSSGTPTVQIARGRQASATTAHAYVDMLSTLITIDATEYDSKDATTAAVINASNDDVATGDLIRVDVDVAGTGTAGLYVTLNFQLP